MDKADSDGWVDRHAAFIFPTTDHFKNAIIEVVRFPSRLDLDLQVDLAGKESTRKLELDRTDRIVVPLSSSQETRAALSADKSFPLAEPDTRTRSFRIVNIDFE